MKGDVILIEDHHYRAAEAIAERLLPRIRQHERRYVITVAGESGSGKSETGAAIAEMIEKHSELRCMVLQQDDYFVHPPRTNDATRRKDIGWVGTQEVKLELLDEHLKSVIEGADEITKPLVIYEQDHVSEEVMSLAGVQVVVAEGTYTSLLKNVDARVFIARNRLETLESRKKRGREAIEPFLEEVLQIEHEIIAPHREFADIVITRDYEVEFVTL